jgi:hypothetical protein
MIDDVVLSFFLHVIFYDLEDVFAVRSRLPPISSRLDACGLIR